MTKKTTCKCGNPRRPRQNNCLECHSKTMKDFRKNNRMTPEQRLKDNCRSYAGVYLRRGKLERKPCEVCGEKAQMHHNDYSKPLEVTWLCRKHHLELHAKESA